MLTGRIEEIGGKVVSVSRRMDTVAAAAANTAEDIASLVLRVAELEALVSALAERFENFEREYRTDKENFPEVTPV